MQDISILKKPSQSMPFRPESSCVKHLKQATLNLWRQNSCCSSENIYWNLRRIWDMYKNIKTIKIEEYSIAEKQISLVWHVTRVNSANVQYEGLRIGRIGHQMNSKVKSVKQGMCQK
jgi:hypothetical protein